MSENGNIVYALIARHTTILSEYTATRGNFPTVTRVILSKIKEFRSKTEKNHSNKIRKSYLYDNHIFHYLIHGDDEGGIIYLCMCDNQSDSIKGKRRLAFAFLEDIREKFKKRFRSDEIINAGPFFMNEEFSPILMRQMEYYNNPTKDNIFKVKGQLEEVKSVAIENIEKVLDRGEKINLLVDKTDRLNQQAFRFEKTSKQLKNTMFWRKIKTYLLIFLGFCIILFFLIAIFCGGLTFKNC